MKTKTLLAALLIGVAGYQVHAITLLGTTVGETFATSLSAHDYVAQAFAFSGGIANLSSVSFLHDNSGPSFEATLNITTAIGENATSGDVVFSTSFTVPSGISPQAVSIPAPIALASGLHYLVLSTMVPSSSLQSKIVFADISAGVLGVGAIGRSYFSGSENIINPYASRFHDTYPSSFWSRYFFTIDGEFIGTPDLDAARALVAIPEPVPDSNSTAPMLALALGVILINRHASRNRHPRQ